MNETQKVVTGTVKLKLYKGSITVSSRSSIYSLYNTNLATYTNEDTFDHKASEGFIKIFGLPYKTFHQVQEEAAKASVPAVEIAR